MTFCVLCGQKAVKWTVSKRRLCAGHLAKLSSYDQAIEERMADMPVDIPSLSSHETTKPAA